MISTLTLAALTATLTSASTMRAELRTDTALHSALRANDEFDNSLDNEADVADDLEERCVVILHGNTEAIRHYSIPELMKEMLVTFEMLGVQNVGEAEEACSEQFPDLENYGFDQEMFESLM